MSTKAMHATGAGARYVATAEGHNVPWYKQTAVGVIPQDWEQYRLGELASVTAGGTPSRANALYWNGEIPWITTADVDFHTIDYAEQFITAAGLSNSAAKLFPPGTILMALYGQGKTRGKVGILGIEATTNQACAAILLNRGVSGVFLFHFLSSRYEAIRSLSNTGNQENLSSSLVRSISIVLPTKTEQRAIAEALSDVDGLLGALEALIAKKRAIKQAAMQQLLAGKTRLPGFSSEWETKRLGELGYFFKGSGVTRDEAQSGPLACVRYGEIYTIHNDYIRTCHSWISADVAASATRLERGDLLFAGSGETKEEIGKCVAFIDDREAYAGGDVVILRPSGAESLFLGYALNTSVVNRQKASRGQGDAVVHISATALAQVCLPLPQPAEQRAIANILSDMDAEIAALERRRDKTRAIKQGMMQQLLTGRIRLVVPCEPVAASS